MAGYRLVSYEWGSFDKEIILKRIPSNVAKFFGAKHTTHKFIGNCTVWSEEKNGFYRSCGLGMEEMLYNFFTTISIMELKKDAQPKERL